VLESQSKNLNQYSQAPLPSLVPPIAPNSPNPVGFGRRASQMTARGVAGLRSAATSTVRGLGEFFGVSGGEATMNRWRQQYQSRNAMLANPQPSRLASAYGNFDLSKSFGHSRAIVLIHNSAPCFCLDNPR
jgi:hypothetical protein